MRACARPSGLHLVCRMRGRAPGIGLCVPSLCLQGLQSRRGCALTEEDGRKGTVKALSTQKKLS